MTTETATIATFDVPKARQELANLEQEKETAQANLEAAVANSDMAAVLRLVPQIGSLTTEIEKLAKKIARETGEQVITAKVQIATRLKLWIAENVTRNPEFQSIVGEMQAANPKFRAVNIDFSGDATQPDAVNIVGGFRQSTKPAGTTKRPRARWYNESLGNNEDGTPRALSTKDAILAYGGKYWNDVFGADSAPASYDNMDGNARQKLIEAIAAGESFRNLAKE